MKRINLHRITLVVLIVTVVVSIPVTVLLVSQNQDLRSKAFSGVSVDTGTLSQVTNLDPQPLTTIPADPTSLVYLYHKLYDLYPEAEMVNVTDSTLNLNGVAASVYDPEIDTSFIFIRIENIPYFELTPLNMWLKSNDSTNLVASAQYNLEETIPVSYIVYSAPGNLEDSFSEAILSYEKVNEIEPLLPFITLSF